MRRSGITENQKPLVELNDSPLRLTDTHHHDSNSRPRPFNQRPINSMHSRTVTVLTHYSSPFRSMIIRFPAFRKFHGLRPLVFTIVFPHFSASLSIFASPRTPTRLWFPPAYQPTILSTMGTLSIELFSMCPTRMAPRNSVNPKRHICMGNT